MERETLALWERYLATAKPGKRLDGSIESALKCAKGFAAQGLTSIIYCGNSYGSGVWRVTLKRSDARSMVNNPRGEWWLVSPQLTVTEDRRVVAEVSHAD